MTEKLSQLRDQVRAVDEELFQLVAKRLDLARQIGALKFEAHLPIKDYQVEKAVLERSRQRAEELGIYPSLAEDLARLMIRYAVITQDANRQQRERQLAGPAQNVVIVGGRGRMGGWLSEFFEAFGHNVSHVDNAASDSSSPYPLLPDLHAARDANIIVLSTPIAQTAAVIDQLVDLKTTALVFDICSLKTPLLPSIGRARRHGIKISSVHPMFGPDADILVGRNIMICHIDDPAITAAARALFEPTTANITEVPLARHDQLMSYVLGLSHLSNLVFAEVLASSGAPYRDLLNAASTTFNSQIRVTTPVTRENQDLYFEIQAENSYTPELIAALEKALSAYRQTISQHDREQFRALMSRARDYLGDTEAAP